LTDASEPEYFVEAMQGDEYITWELAMEDKIVSFEMVEKPRRGD